MNIIDKIGEQYIKSDVPDFRPGDTVKVHTKVVEGEKERIQVYEGTVLQRAGSGVGETFTVRRVAYGVAVERLFPLNSQRVEKIEIVRKGRVRRARLNYLKDRIGKSARIKDAK